MQADNPQSRRGRWERRAAAVVVIAGAVGIVAVSLAPDPHLVKLGWIPAPVAEWADRNPTLRTAVPFAILGALVGLPLQSLRTRAIGLGAVVLLLLATEGAQAGIPMRVFDPADLLWGLCGIAIGAISAALVRNGRNRQ